MQSRRELTLIILRITPTVLKTAFAGVMLERFSAIVKPSMMTFNKERASSRRFDCLDFSFMGLKSRWKQKQVAAIRL